MITEVPGPTPLPDGMELRRDVAKGHALSQEDLGELRTLSRGQAFDVLSSQANIAGYRAVI